MFEEQNGKPEIYIYEFKSLVYENDSEMLVA